MPKDHLALALAIEPTYLTTLVDRIKSVLPCACYAVLAAECVFTMSAATPSTLPVLNGLAQITLISMHLGKSQLRSLVQLATSN